MRGALVEVKCTSMLQLCPLEHDFQPRLILLEQDAQRQIAYNEKMGILVCTDFYL